MILAFCVILAVAADPAQTSAIAATTAAPASPPAAHAPATGVTVAATEAEPFQEALKTVMLAPANAEWVQQLIQKLQANVGGFATKVHKLDEKACKALVAAVQATLSSFLAEHKEQVQTLLASIEGVMTQEQFKPLVEKIGLNTTSIAKLNSVENLRVIVKQWAAVAEQDSGMLMRTANAIAALSGKGEAATSWLIRRSSTTSLQTADWESRCPHPRPRSAPTGGSRSHRPAPSYVKSVRAAWLPGS